MCVCVRVFKMLRWIFLFCFVVFELVAAATGSGVIEFLLMKFTTGGVGVAIN